LNYAALVVAISDYTENTFNTVDMNTFIVQAEQRIYNMVQFPATRSVATTALTANTPYFNCPNDFLSVLSFAVIDSTGAYTYLLDKDPAFIREAYSLPSQSGTPKYYAIFGTQAGNPLELQFILGPTPNLAYATELTYFAYPISITVAASGQTWLGDNFDSVLLYGALVEAYTFMKGETDLIQLYDGKFKEAVALAKRLGDGLQKQDMYRNGQAKMPVT
jgi:hypothetical protein